MEFQSCKGLVGEYRFASKLTLNALLGRADDVASPLDTPAAVSAASAASACCIRKSSHWSARESSAACLELELLRDSAPATLLNTPLRGRVRPTLALSSSAGIAFNKFCMTHVCQLQVCACLCCINKQCQSTEKSEMPPMHIFATQHHLSSCIN